MKHLGKLNLHKERKQIEKRSRTFERIDRSLGFEIRLIREKNDLDTNALSAAADDDPGVIAQLARADEMAIPVIVLGEYRHGIAQSRNRAPTRTGWRDYSRTAQSRHHEPTTHSYAEIVLELKRKGKRFQPTTSGSQRSAQHSLPLLSRDRHFDLVAGNKRVGW